MQKPACLFFLVLLLAACAPDQPDQKAKKTPVPERRARRSGHVPKVVSITFSKEDTTLAYRARVSYPAIQEHEVFNQAVQGNLKEGLAAFEAFIREFEGAGRTLEGEYQLVQRTDSVISVRQVYEWALPGVSTLQYDIYTTNYDPYFKELIGLKQLFRPGVDYKALLKKRLQEVIRSRHGVETTISDEDLSRFTIGFGYLEFYKVLYPEVMEPEPKAIPVQFSELEGKMVW